jgi:hypothetical protein
MKSGVLKLDLLDASGNRLAQPVDVTLWHQSSGAKIVAKAPKSSAVRIKDLQPGPNGLYRVHVDPPSYLPVASFVDLPASGEGTIALRFPVDPDKVKPKFPKFPALPAVARQLLEASDAVLKFDGKSGATLYDDLDDLRKAGMFNIAAKASRTSLSTGRSILSYVQRILELRGDRCFVVVSQELREEVKNSALSGHFFEARSTLHRPPDGFDSAGSWKTPDHYGNLQVTFFAKGPSDWVADIDIDDAGGLAHVFQVLRNHLTGRPTHPYDIQQILLLHQKINPGYELTV